MKTKYYCYGAKFKCADYEEFLIWDKDNLDTFVKTDEGFEWVGGTWLMRDYTSVIYYHYDMVNNPSYTPMSDEDFKELTEKEFSDFDCVRLDLSKPIEETMNLTIDYLKINEHVTEHDIKQLVINCPNVTFTDMDDNNISDGERTIYTSKEFVERMEEDGIKGVYGYYRIVY